jgi:hypothetical protein
MKEQLGVFLPLNILGSLWIKDCKINEKIQEYFLHQKVLQLANSHGINYT